MLELLVPMNHFNQFQNSFSVDDKEASFLYGLWKESSPGTNKFKISNKDAGLISNLKKKGYISSSGDNLEFTDKAKKIIIEMVTNEPNALEKNSASLSYSKIKDKNASKKRSSNQAFLKKKASIEESQKDWISYDIKDC
jgi:hypothetical protein